jgi:hypothetical protein
VPGRLGVGCIDPAGVSGEDSSALPAGDISGGCDRGFVSGGGAPPPPLLSRKTLFAVVVVLVFVAVVAFSVGTEASTHSAFFWLGALLGGLSCAGVFWAFASFG